MASLSAADFKKHSLPTAAALEFGEQHLRDVAGFASLIRPETLGRPFAIAPISATEAELVAFESGKYWRQRVCDEALLALVSYPSPSWTVFQNAWSEPGDFANFDTGDHFFVGENYFHPATRQDQLELDWWRSASVGYPKTIYVTSFHARSQFPSLGSIASSEDAAHLASSVFGILMSAYDDESWVGFDVAWQPRE